MSFSKLGLPSAFDEALAKQQIVDPTPVQTDAIPALLEGKDVYVSAETGTGKTLAYLLPIMSRIDPGQKTVQALVLAPTHELAVQIGDEARRFATDLGTGIGVSVLIGGGAIKRQQERLKKRKPQLVIGSAGRILELIQLRKLKAHNVKTVVIDEVDKLLFGDAVDTVKKVINAPLRDRQLVYASATVHRESRYEASVLSPELLVVNTREEQVNSDIEHFVFLGREDDKAELLRKLLHAFKPERAMVFVHRNQDVEDLANLLAGRKIPVAAIHGNQDKFARREALDNFRSGAAAVLVCSDVVARGMDLKGVTHVFNVDVPGQSNDYLHRAGRTGRAGTKGYCISLITHADQGLVKRYRKQLKIEIAEALVKHGRIFIDEGE